MRSFSITRFYNSITYLESSKPNENIQKCGYFNISQTKHVNVIYFLIPLRRQRCHFTMTAVNLLMRSAFAAEICLGWILTSVSMSVFVFSSAISNGSMCCKGLFIVTVLFKLGWYTSSSTPIIKLSLPFVQR